ncbi:MAG: STAS domain-containing protein [Planctomycetes bacterium]|nr:STAS domain-containing protein [Planctomycetota bacterium]
MLKITRVLDGESGLLLRLEGKLLGPWVEELAGVCTEPDRPCRVRLDLSAVTFVDVSGERILRALMDRGVVIAAASGFVAALLRLEDR